MGKYDDITHEQLRDDLVKFAQLILRLEREDALLSSPADLQTLLGELRQKLFAWEVRASRRFKGEEGAEEAPAAEPEPAERRSGEEAHVRESLRIVREALRREEELLQEWDESAPPEEDDEEGE